MARVIAKYKKNQDKPYAYNIRVFRGKDAKGKELKPYQMTWEIPEGLKDEKRIQNALKKVVGEFETDCNRGNIAIENRILSEYVRYFMSIAARDNKIKSVTYYESMLPLIDQELGYMRTLQITTKNLNKFYLFLQYEDIRRDKKAIAKDKLIVLKNEQKITHKNLCEMANLSDNTIRLMCQKKRVSIESAQKVSNSLNKPFKELFDVFYTRR